MHSGLELDDVDQYDILDNLQPTRVNYNADEYDYRE